MTTSAGSYAVWAVLLLAAVLLWCLPLVSRYRVARPSEVVSRLATHPIWRVGLVLGWMFVGWHLFAR
jgi:Family of unknown function (DUF6186)